MNLKVMFIISIISGLLSTMNIWAVKLTHVKFHLNDLYMSLLMAGWMILFASILMKEYQYTIVSALIIIITLYLIRTQTFIDKNQFLKGMIPHHSMAILMSERVKEKTDDSETLKLANDIIDAQNKEINQMEKMLSL